MTEKYIVKSKNVFTGNESAPAALSILVNGSFIEKVMPYDADCKDAAVYDYGESMMMPSFIDAHSHILTGALDASEYVCSTLGECSSEEECARMMGEYAALHPEQKRLRGSGWIITAWGDAPLPTRKSLDRAVPDRPVYLNCADGHSFWVNSKAIEEMGLPDDYDVENGIVVRDEDGHMTGMLVEPAAYAPANAKYMEFSREEYISMHENLQKIAASYGIGAFSEMTDSDYTHETEEKFQILRDMDEEGKLSSYVYLYTRCFGYTDFKPYFDIKKKIDSRHVSLAGLKGFIDGVVETYTGLLLEPYTDRPDTCGEGVPLRPKELMQQEIIAANKAGIQVRLHCISDGSVRMALDMYEASGRETDIRPLRNTVEHMENMHPDDFKRFEEIGVVPSVQPYHLTISYNDMVIRLGKERCKYEFPNRSLWEHTDKLAMGTDYPVVTLDPFRTIYAALTRWDDDGVPTGQNSDTQKLPMDVILKCYTKNSARVYHCEDKMGSIEEGKMANFIVLSDNLFEIPPEKVPDVKVTVNYFEGKEIYRA